MKYEQFKLIIYKLSNIDLNCYKERQMKRRIDTFIKKNNYKEYGSSPVEHAQLHILISSFDKYSGKTMLFRISHCLGFLKNSETLIVI